MCRASGVGNPRRGNRQSTGSVPPAQEPRPPLAHWHNQRLPRPELPAPGPLRPGAALRPGHDVPRHPEPRHRPKHGQSAHLRPGLLGNAPGDAGEREGEAVRERQGRHEPGVRCVGQRCPEGVSVLGPDQGGTAEAEGGFGCLGIGQL